MSDINNNFLMPEFTIDPLINDNGKVINVGVKRMYDIAYEIKDSIMQWGMMGCIAGDMKIRGHWGGKSKKDNRKGVIISKIYKHQHNISYPGSYQIKSKDFFVKTYNEETGLIEETKVNSTYSGKKQCYLIKTESKEVEVTEEHPFLTERGWIKCSELKIDDVVYIYPNTSKGLCRLNYTKTKENFKEDEICTKVIPDKEKVLCIVPTGIKDTYDLTCEKNHNFFAGDILVHNCGKSQAVQQWNYKKFEQDANWDPNITDVRLSMKEPVDLVGIPYPVQIDGKTKTVWCIPSIWPEDGKFSGGVIHLDEMNQGQPAILNAAFQLIQDRRLGDYKVPDNYLIIASSNPPAFNQTVSDLSMPLSNRFTHFNIKPDFNSWLEYEINNGGNLDVMTFLKTQDTSMLYDKSSIENKLGSTLNDTLYTDIFVTPRSWEVVGKVLDLPDDKFTMQEKQAYCTGRLGSLLSSKLFKFIKNKDKYQDWHTILVDGNDFRNETQDQFWAVEMACVQAIVAEKDDEKCRKYILKYVKALSHLSNKELKACCFMQLCRCERCRNNLDLFNPRTDAPEFVLTLTNAVRG